MRVAIYAAHGAEVDLSALHALRPTAELLYPLCHPGQRLSFHRVQDPDELSPGRMGIREPDPRRHPEIELERIDLFICPGVAFGRDLTRLGQGGGFYDRALARKSSASHCLGVAFHCQIMDSVPHHPHDIKMQQVITEQGELLPPSG